METKTYSNSNKYSIRQILFESLRGYKNSFYLAKQLAVRDIRSQYRQSILGVFWGLVPVLSNAFVWIFLQSSGTIKLDSTNVPYPLFVVLGTTIWSLFSECLMMPISTVNANIGIITKINFDKEALISLGFIKILFNLSIKLGLILFFLIYFQIMPSSSFIMFVPILGLIMLLFISLGIILTPIGVLYNDVNKFIPFLFQLLMYVSPVLYLTPKEGYMEKIISINPLSYIIIDIRNSLTGMPIENWFFLLAIFIFTIILALFSLIVYRVSMPILTERMSS